MESQNNSGKTEKWIYDFCRYFVAFVIVCYGWAKIMGSQFTILDSELDKPMGEVSGFWLTWYYFGYSPFYGNFIALIQIVAGFLLLCRRTVLLAACVLFGVIGNIILIDIFYGVDLGALIMAGFLEGALFIILNFHRRELVETFWTRQNSLFPIEKKHSSLRIAKILICALIVLIPPNCTYYIANYNNRFPTVLDGKWQVVNSSAPVTDGDKPLTKIYFERNRAHMSVFRFGDDKWAEHHFEINPQTNEINIWDKWLTKGNATFSGQYELQNDKLVLRGQLQPSNQPVTIELQKGRR
jgi:hypothetical protein